MNVYLPDDLCSRVKSELGDVNLSRIFQQALIAELDRKEKIRNSLYVQEYLSVIMAIREGGE